MKSEKCVQGINFEYYKTNKITECSSTDLRDDSFLLFNHTPFLQNNNQIIPVIETEKRPVE